MKIPCPFKHCMHLSGVGYCDMSSVEVTVTLYLTDDGWIANGNAPDILATIPPGIYGFSHVFVNQEGEIGFNYKTEEIEPEFVGKDFVNLTKTGSLIFQTR